MSAQRDGDKGKIGTQHLQEGNLHLERVFVLVSDRVLAEGWTSLQQLRGEIGIDGSIAQRGSPSSRSENRRRFAVRKVSYAEDDDATWQRHARVNRTGNATGIHIAGMRNDTSTIDGQGTRGILTRVGFDECSQFVWIVGIKRAGDSGEAKHECPRFY